MSIEDVVLYTRIYFHFFSLIIRFVYERFSRTSSLNYILFSKIMCATFEHSVVADAAAVAATSFTFTSLTLNECATTYTFVLCYSYILFHD